MKRILQILFSMIVTALLVPLGTQARDFSYAYKGNTLKYTVLSEDEKTC